ncbi:MAG: polyphosphate kinase 2 family protein, partial [Methanoregulaceae archaeon]|nr:polyphosphate kinase 2 family protein [Methanoregulaceae archaeon]
MIKKKYINRLRVVPGKKVKLAGFPTSWAEFGDLKEAGKDKVRERADEVLEASRGSLATAQELLYASNIHSVLIILQGMDTAGKDGTIKHVMSGVNPQGCRVTS